MTKKRRILSHVKTDNRIMMNNLDACASLINDGMKSTQNKISSISRFKEINDIYSRLHDSLNYSFVNVENILSNVNNYKDPERIIEGLSLACGSLITTISDIRRQYDMMFNVFINMTKYYSSNYKTEKYKQLEKEHELTVKELNFLKSKIEDIKFNEDKEIEIVLKKDSSTKITIKNETTEKTCMIEMSNNKEETQQLDEPN